MMKAEKMFQKIGYHVVECNDEYISYCCKSTDGAIFWISFEREDKTFYVDRNDRPKDITIGEFKAINKQMKELGWL